MSGRGPGGVGSDVLTSRAYTKRAAYDSSENQKLREFIHQQNWEATNSYLSNSLALTSSSSSNSNSNKMISHSSSATASSVAASNNNDNCSRGRSSGSDDNSIHHHHGDEKYYYAFGYALRYAAPLCIIQKLIELGGGAKELINHGEFMQMEEHQQKFRTHETITAIHLAARYCTANVVKYLLEIGDSEALLMDRYEDSHYESHLNLPIYYSLACNPDIHVTCILCEAWIRQGIDYYNVGGLLDQRDGYNDTFPFKNVIDRGCWEEVVTHLEPIIMGQPVIQGAHENFRQCRGCSFKDDAEKIQFYKEAIMHFDDWIVTTADRYDVLPIEAAIEYRFCWDDGLKELVTKFSKALGRHSIHVALEYGITWEQGIKDIVEELRFDVSMVDDTNGLLPFMQAGVGSAKFGKKGLTTVYKMLLLDPSLVQPHKKGESTSIALQSKRARRIG